MARVLWGWAGLKLLGQGTCVLQGLGPPPYQLPKRCCWPDRYFKVLWQCRGIISVWPRFEPSAPAVSSAACAVWAMTCQQQLAAPPKALLQVLQD